MKKSEFEKLKEIIEDIDFGEIKIKKHQGNIVNVNKNESIKLENYDMKKTE